VTVPTEKSRQVGSTLLLLLFGVIVACSGGDSEEPASSSMPTTSSTPSVTIAPSGQNSGSPLGSSPLLLGSNRDHVVICVEDGLANEPGDTSAEEQRVASEIAALVPRLERLPGWVASNTYGKDAEVVAGCGVESTAIPYMESNPNVRGFNVALPRAVNTPGRYRLIVYVLSDERMALFTGGSEVGRQSTEEILCYGHVCFAVTTGLYVSLDEVEDDDLLFSLLADGLALE
jgi:hypothetical protein